jgi:hypothetical protein
VCEREPGPGAGREAVDVRPRRRATAATANSRRAEPRSPVTEQIRLKFPPAALHTHDASTSSSATQPWRALGRAPSGRPDGPLRQLLSITSGRVRQGAEGRGRVR